LTLVAEAEGETAKVFAVESVDDKSPAGDEIMDSYIDFAYA